MEEKSTNSPYSNYEFEELLQDKANLVCFDCGRGPASWASVNNAIYLCMNCAGEHRSYGVSVSYIRSINIDKWNDTQINCMKVGGNRRLEELLTKFEVPRKTSPKILYSSKLLEYHRHQIKSDVNKGKQITPPSAEEALEPAVSVNVSNNVNTNSNFNASNSIYSVTSSGSNDFNGGNNQNQANFFSFSSFGSMLNSALETGKSVASNVTDKIKEMDLTNKIITTGTKGLEVMKDTGSKTFDVLKDTSSKVMEKGKEYGVSLKKIKNNFIIKNFSQLFLNYRLL